MPKTYIKKVFPATWNRLKPTYEVSFDTSSQYITNTITPFDVINKTQASYSSSTSNVMTVGSTNYTMNLSDDFIEVDGWKANNTSMTSGTPIRITEDTEFEPGLVIIHKDRQGPCPNGYHIGGYYEWTDIKTALQSLNAWGNTITPEYLKIPNNYYLNRSNGSINTSYGPIRLWTASMDGTSKSAQAFIVHNSTGIDIKGDKSGNGFGIRPFKDTPVVPDSNWTTILAGTGNAGIFWNATLGLISVSSNGTTWYTIADKNLGATNVGDVGLYYQWGNNYGFNPDPTNYRTTKVPDVSAYGPRNYYNDSTFTRVSSGDDWFSNYNRNMWGGVSNSTWKEPV